MPTLCHRPAAGERIAGRRRLIMASSRTSSDVFADLAGIIGEDGARALCDTLGGTTVYVPRTIPANHEIALAIGPKRAQVLAEFKHGMVIAVPKAHHRRQRAIEMLMASEAEGGTTEAQVHAIARATDYTRSQIYRMLKDIRSQLDDGQLSLFG
ncbi:hypothetical protein ACPVPU_07385 [Sphingomonas sp. CJ99]